jgi:hypothetical protein
MPFVVLTRDAARLIRASSLRTGRMRVRKFDADERYVADQIETTNDHQVGVRVPFDFEALTWGDGAVAAQWFRDKDLQLPATFLYLRGRRPGVEVPFATFRDLVPGVHDPGEMAGLVIIEHPALPDEFRDAGVPEFTGWLVSRHGVQPFDVQVEPESFGLVQLKSPSMLQQNTVTVVGVGSIGSAAVSALANLGFGQIHLVDPDRLLWHNLIRHQLGPESVGRFKVDALKTQLDSRMRPFDDAVTTRINAHRVDVVEQADALYRLLSASDVVLCAADGIAPRRAVNHIARLTKTPAIFACVLEDGAVGELIRSRPGTRFGCLMCHRAALRATKSMDPELDQELGYGTGNPHKPMSAAPHDLRLMGDLAAKMTAATVLESLHGDIGQHLPGEQMIIGLRPGLPLAAPFDVASSGEVKWGPVPPPRTDCATCSLA